MLHRLFGLSHLVFIANFTAQYEENIMTVPSDLFNPLSDAEIAQACQLQHREFAMFSALLCLLSDAASREKLSCLPQLAAVRPRQPSGSDRFRSAFLRCYRLLSLTERKYVKAFFLDSLRQSYYATLVPGSYLLHSWLIDEEDRNHDQGFLFWCAQNHCQRLSAADMFLLLVQLKCHVLRDNFKPVWSGLAISSSAKLRAMMWRIIRCGADTIEQVKSAGETRYLIKTARFTCEI